MNLLPTIPTIKKYMLLMAIPLVTTFFIGLFTSFTVPLLSAVFLYTALLISLLYAVLGTIWVYQAKSWENLW